MKDTNNNLIPFNKRSKEEHREISHKGGIRSGEARRRKREQIEYMKLHDIAIKEERESNIQLLAEAADLLVEIRKEAKLDEGLQDLIISFNNNKC